MSLLKWFKADRKKGSQKNAAELELADTIERREDDVLGRNEDEATTTTTDGTRMVYFVCSTPHPNVLETLQGLTKETVQTFLSETDCVEYITPITTKLFLIVDGPPPATLLELIENLKQIDSLFVYSSSSDAMVAVREKERHYLINHCENVETLKKSIERSREELDKQTEVFSMYNKKEKATRDLSKEAGSFLFFQLFKSVLKNMPKTEEAKVRMVTTCRNYYRGNMIEMANIDDFEKNYDPVEAIPWYTKETFVYKFINKALRTENVDVLYEFRFFIIDLSEQLELKFQQLKETQKDVLKLYRGLKLSQEEVENFQHSIGNLISTNGYLSTSSEYSVAYGFASKPIKRANVVRALFEYQVDLNLVHKIVIADVREYSAFPEEAEVLVDIGASFQIDACEFNESDQLWYIRAHATDQGAALAAEYLEYQKKRMVEMNITLMFGNLLLDMGEYAKAERYFDMILNSSKPNEEEIACIYFNFGRTNRLKGDFARAIRSYEHAYGLHINARPKRLASAGKTLNGLGVVYSEQGKQFKAEECFRQTLKLFKRAIPKGHIDVAGTLINLATIDCYRKDYDRAESKYLKAQHIYDRSLPFGHPNRAITRMNLGNVYRAAGEYEKARIEYEFALELQEKALPSDHPDIARTLHNLAVVYSHLHDTVKAKEYLERAEETAKRTLSEKHPMMALLHQTSEWMAIDTADIIYCRL